MKNHFLKLFLFLLTTSILTIQSCKKDEVTTPTVEPADKFVANYNGVYTEKATGISASFKDIECKVTKKSASEVNMTLTLFTYPYTITANVKNDSTLDIPIQSYTLNINKFDILAASTCSVANGTIKFSYPAQYPMSTGALMKTTESYLGVKK
jgi:hypothetical protein